MCDLITCRVELRAGPTSVRQLRDFYHLIMNYETCGFIVADSAFYNVHMIEMS